MRMFSNTRYKFVCVNRYGILLNLVVVLEVKASSAAEVKKC